MFNDLAFRIFGDALDPFYQLFVFEPILVTVIAVILSMILKKSWIVPVFVIVINLIDVTLYSMYLHGAEGMGAIIMDIFPLFFAKFFSMFYELVISYLIVKSPFMHNKFGIA